MPTNDDRLQLPVTAAVDRPLGGAPAVELLLVDTGQAAAMCGISPASWYRLAAAGKIGPVPVKLGGRVLWRVSELKDWTATSCPDRRAWQALAAQRNGRPQ